MELGDARKYIAIVNGGSGCLIQPMTKQYTYLLTAKHTIQDAGGSLFGDEIVLFRNEADEWVRQGVKIPAFEEGVQYFPHSEKDIAIIKLPYLNDVEVYRGDNFNKSDGPFVLMGHPETRRNTYAGQPEMWYREDDIAIKDSKGKDLFEGKIEDKPSQVEVKGHSGGCIGAVKKGRFYILGIQNQMAAKGEALGRVFYTGIRAFDEIIDKYPKELKRILPPYLECFSFLGDEIFNVNAGIYQGNIDYLLKVLKDKAKGIIKDKVTPVQIRDHFKERLLLYNKSPEVLQSKMIWIMWMEFLTVMNLLKRYSSLSIVDLEGLFRTTRLLCSDSTDDWSDELENMIYADYKGLEKGGLVVIGMAVPPKANMFVLDRGIVDIANAIKTKKKGHDKGMLQIDDGIDFPLEDFKFVHIDLFKKPSIEDSAAKYKDIDNENELIEILVKQYKSLMDE